MDEKWLNEIVNQLADYEAKAPEGLWERIDSSLKSGATAPRMMPLTRHTFLRKAAFRIAAIALLTLLIGGGVVLYLDDEQLQSAPELADAVLPSSPQSVRSDLQSSSRSEASLHGAPSLSTQFPDAVAALSAPSEERNGEVHLQKPLHIEPTDTKHVAMEHADTNQAVQQQSNTERQAMREVPHRHSQRGYFVPAAQRTESKSHSFSISLLASNVFSDNNQGNGPGGVAMSGGDKYLAQEPVSSQIQSGYGAVNKHLIGNDGARIFDQEKHHKQPVRVGLSVAYPLSERLAIGLGLYYTYLSSDFKSGSEHNYQSAHQSLHYLGIPLSANYTFIRSSRFSFYATGGVMAEKCISGQSELLTVSGNSREAAKQSLTEKHLQYSTFGSLGVQLDLIKHVGLYVEPGLSYYFDNHSRVVNLYKDEPLQFNLSAGVRFSF